LKILRRRGVKSPRNRRDSVEELLNHLGRALAAAREREREERCFARLGFEGVLSPLIYRLKPEIQTCLVNTALAVPKISETA
jgi:hypothetical protein